jgi:porin
MVWNLRRPRWRLRATAAIAAAAAGACLVHGPAAAQTSEQESDRVPGLPEPSIGSSLPRDLADPGGVRVRLAARGIIFAVNYIGEVLGNPTGGYRQGTTYDGRLELAVQADLEKGIGWPGLSFFANGYQIHGDSISADNLGVLMPVSFIEADPATRLFELWLEQKLWADTVSIRFGQLAVDSEFMLSKGGEAFLNGTWEWPSIAAANMPQNGPAYPLATPGVRVAFAPDDKLGFLVGVFNGDPAGNCSPEEDPQECNPNGLLFPIDAPPLLMVEGTYKYNRGPGALAGTIKLGAYRNFGEFRHQRVISGGVRLDFTREPPRLIDGDSGGYAVIDQMLYRRPGAGDVKGVAAFGRVVGAPANRNPIDLYWEAGLTFTGMHAWRPDDVLGIGFAHTGISSDITERQKERHRDIIASYEALLEVSYIARIVPGFIVQPDFQYFWNPGGHVPDPEDPLQAIPNAAVLGVRTTINY